MKNKTLREVSGVPLGFKSEGKEYHLSPLTLNDLAEIESWVVANELSRYREVSKCLEGEEKMKFLRDSVSCIPRGLDFKMMVHEAMDEIDGVRRLLWLSLRKQAPELELHAACEMVTLDNMDEISLMIDVASGMTIPEVKKKKKAVRKMARKMRFLIGLRSFRIFGSSRVGDQNKSST